MTLRPNTFDEDIVKSVSEVDEYRLALEPGFKPEDIIIDIGSHIGGFALACVWHGASCVHCFEASEENFEILVRNVERINEELEGTNGWVTCERKAVWKSSGHTLHFCGLSGANTGGSNIFASDGETVETLSLDTILEDFETVRLLKLDCEGAEWSILFSCTQLHKVEQIVLETHTWEPDKVPEIAKVKGHPDFTPRALASFLRRQGFEVEYGPTAGNLGLMFAKRKPIDPELLDDFRDKWRKRIEGRIMDDVATGMETEGYRRVTLAGIDPYVEPLNVVTQQVDPKTLTPCSFQQPRWVDIDPRYDDEQVTDESALARAHNFIEHIPPYPGNFKGRGIVIAAGGVRYFTSAWVGINLLRAHGCCLPIQMWHLGPSEVDERMKEIVAPLGVECVDAYEIRKIYPARRLFGWEIKPYAILHCPFREVLLLDADNMALKDPTYLFDSAEYKSTGAIFWPDLGRLARERMIWHFTGVEYQDEPEFESGQLYIDKGRTRAGDNTAWQALNLTMWYNEHSDFFYNHVHGDKETFHMAWRKFNLPYSMPGHRVQQQHTLFQHDFQGNRLFQHQHKWSTDQVDKPVDGVVLGEQCMGYMQQLRRLWNGRINAKAQETKSPAEQTAIEALCTGRWQYDRVGYGARPMEFKRDYTIGFGAARMETHWDLSAAGDGHIYLEIRSDTELTCRLVWGGESYTGRWERHEQMPVELTRL
jgi:FkbM family methyltransferase